MRGETEKRRVKAGDHNSSNPYAEYIESIAASKSKRSSSSSLQKAVSGAPTSPSNSLDPILDSKDKNTHQEAVDLVSAREKWERCRTPEERSDLKAQLQPNIISRLEKLSKMEQIPDVGKEIADAVDFLKLLNPSDPIFVEIGNISRKGVINLQDGVMQLKEAQEKLISQLRSLPLHDNKNH